MALTISQYSIALGELRELSRYCKEDLASGHLDLESGTIITNGSKVTESGMAEYYSDNVRRFDPPVH